MSETTPPETAATIELPLAEINPEQFLSFYTPFDATSEQKTLAADITSLDHPAHQQLGAGTPEWAEVLGMLKNLTQKPTWPIRQQQSDRFQNR